MPNKILRLGYTESSLLFYYWLNKYKNINTTEIIDNKKNGLNGYILHQDIMINV